ncbi:MAG: transketolase [Culicoidibacterales bacterium]
MNEYTWENQELDLQLFSQKIRLELLKQLQHRGFGHYGGSLSIVEVLGVVYGKWLRNTVGKVKPVEDDWFVLSKGHGGPTVYTILALQGWFPSSLLQTLNENGTNLPSHTDRKLTPGVQMTTGSLGQGISVATGIAKGAKIDCSNQRIFTLVGDGELNEGQCWEAISFAGHHKLDNLIVFVDNNKRQLDGRTVDIMDPLDFVAKFEAFGFDAQEVKGDDVIAIDLAIERAFSLTGKAHAIILDTIKGQGVKYLEELVDNHHLRPTSNDNAAITEAIANLEQIVERGERG